MLIKIKEYKDYLKNKRIAKKELAMIMAALLPAIRKISNNRMLEILTYMADLSPEDIRKILVHSMVETMPAQDNAIR